ncbi:carboxypeptidase inhibitor SmCI-like, partial [Aplysia californica]|uniref:Carboxypeptidase inhibitor SmCI-like n=1 Tax=Aplysia californica TaxID=6500 RepID=A0ABM0JSF9_APLCA
MTDLRVLLCHVPAALAVVSDIQSEQPNYCNQRDRGNGDGAHAHYYFNQDSQSCELFTYGGEGGNKNNFRTESECQAACICTQGTDIKLRLRKCARPVYYDIGQGICTRAKRLACNSNVNRFTYEDECGEVCVTARCFLKQKQGTSKRYSYNAATQRCEIFTYNGCNGNLNNFQTREECDRSCTQLIRQNDGPNDRSPDCLLSKKRGICRGTFTKFYYDSQD